MHKQIDKQALKNVNKVLKQHNCRVVKSTAGSARYVVQRERAIANNYGAPVGSWFAIGLAYGEALADVLKDPTARLNKMVGANGWYGSGPNGDNYNPIVLDEREALVVELALGGL